MKPDATAACAPAPHRVLIGLVDLAGRHPVAVLVTAALVAAVSCAAAAFRLEYHTQRTDLVNAHKDYQERWRRYVAEFGDDNDIVVVVQGSDRGRMREALEALADRVARQPDRFDRLFYKVDLRPLRDRALLFLPSEQIARIQNNLQSMGLLLEPPLVGTLDPLLGWRSLSLLGLLHEARDRAGKIVPDRPLGAADDQFLTQLLAISRSAAGALADPACYRNPWGSLLDEDKGKKGAAGPAAPQPDLLAEPQYFFSGDGSLAFLLTRPVRRDKSFTADNESVEAMRSILAAVRRQFPDVETGLTGLPVLENDEMTASQKDSQTASWLALAGVGALYLVVFRGPRYPLLTFGTLLVGTGWALGWLTLTVGHLNILSATFVVMLIGMGDYGVLWVTRYELNRAAGCDVRTALARTASGGGPSILTAACATALAFFAAMLADFQAVAELGWIAGSGVLLCALACFTVLPALLTLVDRRKSGREATAWSGEAGPALPPPLRTPLTWLPRLSRRPGWVLAAAAVLTSLLGVFAFRVSYDHNLLHLQAAGLDSVKWEMTLIEHTAGASWHALSYAVTPEDALALKARYEQLPGVSRVVEIASLVPRDQERKLEQLRDVRHRLRHLPPRGGRIPHVSPDLRRLKTELDCLVGSLQPLCDTDAPPVLLEELRRGLLVLRERMTELPAAACGDRLRDFEERLAGDLAEDLHRLRDVSEPVAIRLADLPESLRTRYVGKTGKWLLRVFAQDCLWDHEPLRQFVERIRTVDPEATGKPFATLEGLDALRHGFQRAGLYALVAVAAVFLLDFRRPRHIVGALAPLAAGVVITLGVMGLCGLTLNPATIIAFPLILGVGAVYGVHVVHDFLRRDPARPYALSFLIGRAILVMAVTNMISFGTLGISRHRGLSGLGIILALGVGCCMATALVFLPAALRLAAGRAAKASEREAGSQEFPRLAA